MLDVKNNFRNKHRTITCRACKEEPETQEHVLEKCPQLHKEEGSKVTKEELISKDINLLKEISHKVIKLIEALKKEEDSEISNLTSARKRGAQKKRAAGKPTASINIKMKKGAIINRTNIWVPTARRHSTGINLNLRRLGTEDEYSYAIV